MMWDLRTSDTRERGRSKSPNRQSPSPAFPVPQSQSIAPYYGYNTDLNHTHYPQATPAYGQYLSRDIPLVSPQGQHQQYQAQVVRVIHHSKHHSKHKHHRHHHHSRSDAQVPSMPIPMPSPSAITPSSSHQSGYTYAPAVSPQHVSHVRPAITHGTVDALAVDFSQKAVLLKPRKRTSSQPKPPAGHTYVNPNDAAHAGHVHGYVADPRNPHFRYSTCSGRRKALCIGINYLGQPNELRGCINDAKHVRQFLIDYGGYRPSDIVLLTDDASDPRSLPTRRNMISAMKWLVRSAKRNDALFFHYSGHGGQTPDLDGDEIDGFDEVIYSMDFQKEGHIVDDELHDIMVKPLPAGCRLTALFDACHSGTVLDLPYMYTSHGRLKGMHISARSVESKFTPADVISWSGCLDEQTSADTFQEGIPVGAMSNAFIAAWKAKPKQTYQEFLTSLRRILNPRYSQKPQLGTSHKIDVNLDFVF